MQAPQTDADRSSRAARRSEAIARRLGLSDDRARLAYLAGLLCHIPARRLEGLLPAPVVQAVEACQRPPDGRPLPLLARIVRAASPSDGIFGPRVAAERPTERRPVVSRELLAA